MEFTPKVILYFATGGLLIAESVALIIGLFIFNKGKSPWLSKQNITFLFLDMLVGASMILIPITNIEFTDPEIASFVLGFTMTLHLFRSIHYFWPSKKPFCANIWLFLVNNIKLAGILALIFI